MRSEALSSHDNMPTDLTALCVWNDGIAIATGVLNNPAVLLSSYLIETATGNTIGTSGEARVNPLSTDTTVAMGFELPQQFCPETEVQIKFRMLQGPEWDSERFILLTLNQESEADTIDGSSKRSVEQNSIQTAPNGYSLNCYPNPVTNIAQFAYEIPEDAIVRISVYDLLGKEIKLVHDGYKPAGRYVVPFNGNTLPTGLYFFRMTAGSQTLTGKFNLVRQ